MSRESAERAVREGDLETALRDLQEEVKKNPGAADLRVFLFQLLAAMGQWERASTQLNVAAELDAKALAMAQMYRAAISCELLRHEIFAGKRSPLVFGEPEPWMAFLFESLLAAAAGRHQHAAELRQQAFEGAPSSSGSIDGVAFEWIADADMRLGPVCEAVIDGRYYWVPFARVSRIEIEPPVDLRDAVWMPANFRFANGGESVGVIPTRYPGSETADDAAVRLARKTVWLEAGADAYHGVGQRMFSTDVGEYPLMDVRTIDIQQTSTADGAQHG